MGVKANRREKETNDVSNRVFPIFLVIVFFLPSIQCDFEVISSIKWL
jgi:hypothetical protein